MNSKWIEEVFPKNVAGGLPGSHGLEELAAVVAHQQAKLGHGISLELSHAFDTVDRSMMESALLKLLPSGSRRWCELLFQQWKGMNRWIVYDKTVHALPLQVSHGIPQDDPAGPLVMNLLMHALMKMVDNQLQMPQDDFCHVLYMEDRTFVGKTKQDVENAQAIWAEVALRFKLKKNIDKAQTVDTSCRFDRFEVLGSLLGCPRASEFNDSRMQKRMSKASMLDKKIGLLPEGVVNKLRDGSIFCRCIMGYGWISLTPRLKDIKALEASMWASLGKTRFANLSLRRKIAGAHTLMGMIAGLRQLRMRSKRNSILQEMGFHKQECLLDENVHNFLESLQWILDGDRYKHELLREGFRLEDHRPASLGKDSSFCP